MPQYECGGRGGGGEGGCLSRVSLRGLALFGKRHKENTPQLGSLQKAPAFDSENNDRQQSGLAERKVGGKLRPDSSDLWPQRGSRHGCRRRSGSPGPSFGQNNFLYKISHADTCARSGGRPRLLPAASALSWDPRTGRRRGGAISSPRRVGEPKLAAGGARGGGTRRPAHSTPAATPRTKWALSQPPGPSLSGSCGGAPRTGTGAARSPKAQPFPSQARLSGQKSVTGRSAAPAEPSRGAGPAPGPGAQRGCRERRAGARLRSLSDGLPLQGCCPELAVAGAVARPGRAKDAPQLFARAPGAQAKGVEEGSAGRGRQVQRLAQPQLADGTG